MFLDILELTVENKKKLFRENCFENLFSDVNNKWFISPQNYFLEKSAKTKKTNKKTR